MSFREEKCAIEKAKPVLEKDLSWGNPLANYLKFVSNVLSSSPKAHCVYNKSTAMKEVEQVEQELAMYKP